MRRLALLVLVLTVAGCSSAPAAPAATAPAPATSAPAASSPTPTPVALGAHPSAAQVATALGCGSVTARTPAKNGGSMPDAVSEVGCTLDSTPYIVDVYASEHDLSNVLLTVSALLGPTLRAPWTFGAGNVWSVGVDTGKNGALVSLPPAMVTAVVAAGGVVKTIKP